MRAGLPGTWHLSQRDLPRVLDMLEDWLGEIVEPMEDAGVFEDAAFIILSDHGQVSLTMKACSNVLQSSFLGKGRNSQELSRIESECFVK